MSKLADITYDNVDLEQSEVSGVLLHHPGLAFNPGQLASPDQPVYEQIIDSVYMLIRVTLLETWVDPG